MAITEDSSIFCHRIITNDLDVSSKNWVFRVFANPIRFGFNDEKWKGNKLKIGVRVVVELGVLKSLEGSLGLDVVTEGELREKGFLGLRKTKLVCTIGPACCSFEDLERLALAGMNVARFNMCHNMREWHWDMIRSIKRLSKEKGFCVTVMIDTKGSQHVVDHGASSSIKVEDGSIWLFTTDKFEGFCPFIVQVNYKGFSEGITVGDELVIDGGRASFEVIEKIENGLRCKCIDPILLLPRAKLSFWRKGKLVEKNHELPTLSTKLTNLVWMLSLCTQSMDI